ncbi:MAG: D-arabinono-1,4-lactone oxidase [Streptosporangiaceae bacterium]
MENAAFGTLCRIGRARPWLIPALNRFGLPYRAYFDRFESIVAEVASRPHWGKPHSLDAGRLGQLYPRFEEFRRVRAEVDPEARFGNSYLTRVLGNLLPNAYVIGDSRTGSGLRPVVRVSGRCARPS